MMSRSSPPTPRGGVSGIVAAAALLVALLLFGPTLWLDVLLPLLHHIGQALGL